MKPLLRFSVILFLFFIGNSCSNSYNDDYTAPMPTPVMVTFSANLIPVEGTGSTAYGDATLILNMTAKTFDLTVNYTGITAIDGHIHAADGTPVFPFPKPLTSPIKLLSIPINDTQMIALVANQYYVNLHTEAFPTGEISGTLIKTGTTGGGGGGGY
jgi:hypothetical protein